MNDMERFDDRIECDACGGSGKTVEEARTTGVNQHSACQMDCEECDGAGRVVAPDDDKQAGMEAPKGAGMHKNTNPKESL